jgi:lipopolysaccharide heptosyltransferase II
MGDVLLTSPAFSALKASLRGVKLSLLTSSVGGQIASFIPEIDDCFIFDVPWVKEITGMHQNEKIAALISQLQKQQFDGAIIFSNFSQNPMAAALVCYLAEIPKRLAYSRENLHGLLTHWVVDEEPFIFPSHGVLRQLQLVEKIGAKSETQRLSVRISETAAYSLENILLERHIAVDKPLLVFHPGVSEEKRMYPVTHLAKAVAEITSQLDCQVLITGTTEEVPLATAVMQIANSDLVFSLAGLLSLEELIALIGVADVLISNNTGPIHIAAATSTPVVVLYARQNPEHTPWKTLQRVLYFDIPEHLRSKNSLLYPIPSVRKPFPSPSQIVLAIQELLQQKESTALPKEIISW